MNASASNPTATGFSRSASRSVSRTAMSSMRRNACRVRPHGNGY